MKVAITEEQRSETDHEVERRLRLFIEQRHVPAKQIAKIRQDIEAVIETIEVVPQRGYNHLEATARRRIPRDPNDWPTVALAIALEADILTNDHDFLGCGCATWTFETLRDELAHSDALH